MVTFGHGDRVNPDTGMVSNQKVSPTSGDVPFIVSRFVRNGDTAFPINRCHQRVVTMANAMALGLLAKSRFQSMGVTSKW